MDRDFLERARPIPHNERASDAVGASPARIVRIAFDGAHGGAVARLHDDGVAARDPEENGLSLLHI